MDYVKGLRQLNNTGHYEILDKDPTSTYNEQVLLVPKQGVNLNIINVKILVLYNEMSTLSTTKMPHIEGISATKRSLQKIETDPQRKMSIYRLANLVLTKKTTSHLAPIYRDKN